MTGSPDRPDSDVGGEGRPPQVSDMSDAFSRFESLASRVIAVPKGRTRKRPSRAKLTPESPHESR